MNPRYKPSYNREDYPDEVFIGYIEEFDLYLDTSQGCDQPITLVGEWNNASEFNYDCFEIDNGQIINSGYEQQDLRLTPYHMCLLYAACIEHGLIKEQDNEAET